MGEPRATVDFGVRTIPTAPNEVYRTLSDEEALDEIRDIITAVAKRGYPGGTVHDVDAQIKERFGDVRFYPQFWPGINREGYILDQQENITFCFDVIGPSGNHISSVYHHITV